MNENMCRKLESFIVLLPTSYKNKPTDVDNNEPQTHAMDLDCSLCSLGQTDTYIIASFRKKNNHNLYHNKASTI